MSCSGIVCDVVALRSKCWFSSPRSPWGLGDWGFWGFRDSPRDGFQKLSSRSCRWNRLVIPSVAQIRCLHPQPDDGIASIQSVLVFSVLVLTGRV
ncbi:hypothetical protein LINPERHAP1_LOCUS29458 [Linum perenne]